MTSITLQLFALHFGFEFQSEGILNGIDKSVWEPFTDKLLAENYSVTNFKKGKQKNKDKLCSQFI